MSAVENPAAFPKLTARQAEALAEVCRTNGGGVRVRCKIDDAGYGLPVSAPMRRLHELGLIQGKSGSYETVVHTREGWRINILLAERAKGGAE